MNSKECFGYSDKDRRCAVFNDGVCVKEKGEKCKFCKPERDVTNGKRYPYLRH